MTHKRLYPPIEGVFFLAFFIFLCACSPPAPETSPGTLNLASTDFLPGGAIPKLFSCDGGDLSPALQWNAPPPSTQSFALIMEDPDAPAGVFVHWVLFDMPPDWRSLPENYPKTEQTPGGARQGKNNFDNIGYGGPCPPNGSSHRYFFKLYALDAKLNLSPGSGKKQVERAMQGHILAQGEYTGRYSR